MSGVEITTDSDVAIAPSGDTVVVLASDDIETIITGEQGPPGAPGAPGAPSIVPGPSGKDGNTILYGASDPDNSIGVNGNFYINTTTNYIFGPKAGSWPTGISMVGPQGTAGNTILYGSVDPTAGVGVNGNFYINTTTHVLFGPKASGAWPAGTSLIGPQGIQGIPGPTGPAGADGAGAPATVAPIMDGVAAVGTSMNFARQDHVHPFDTATVRNNAAQSLTAAQQQQARQNIYAAPFDALAYNGMQINGSMEVSQQNGTSNVTVTGTGKYIIDGFALYVAGVGIGSANQSAIGSLPSFGNCLTVTCTGANPLSGASDCQYVYQPIEGYRWSRLAWGTTSAQPVTVSFWIYPQSAGTIAVAIRNGGTNRTYIVDMPLLANQWQFKTVTFPGCLDGTWSNDNTTAAMLSFCYGAGSGLRGTANSWLTTNWISTAATTNFFATNTGSSTIYLTGVTILPGNEAASAARSSLIMRPYDQELTTCKRYYRKIGGLFASDVSAGGYGVASGGTGMTILLAPEMRAAPTVTEFGTFVKTNCQPYYFPSASALGWQIAPLGVGQMWMYGNPGGFALDARL